MGEPDNRPADVAGGARRGPGADRRGRRAAGRDPAAVTLIAVSKAQPHERVEAALAAGQRVFGENYVQEAQARWPGCGSAGRASSCT